MMIHLSIVVPAYNEESRLPKSLAKIASYAACLDASAEIIVVDDGSTDATARVAASVSTEVPIRVLRVSHRGKAAAVRSGILASTGRYVVFTDADLSTPIQYVDHVLAKLEQGADIAIGSREGILARRSDEPGYRHLMGRGFNKLVQLVAVPGIEDTQCGFKGFRREAAQEVFSSTRLYQNGRTLKGPRVTAFDVELLHIARRRGLRVAEVPVEWRHVPGSKVHPLRDSVRMLMDVMRVRLNAQRGRYDT